ncbi:acyltransferase [Oceanicoccus sp. KOV_DT_Chl]|uniref:acyltransferase family protein n=1 Tax=Oceanicoccus sp. KOV_DT_Chl TaxID=1904639 RepID=UPI000C7C34D8|nr:acyltransferase [Oceanicoccus sp. KOV_DT_Chl]
MRTTPITLPHLAALTSLRGIAALCVVLHHFCVFLFPEIYRLLPSHFLTKSYLWVDLFFILSGFVMTHVYQQRFSSGYHKVEFKRFLLARFARIYPLHFFMLLVFIVFQLLYLYVLANSPDPELVRAGSAGDKRTWLTLLSNFLLLQTFHSNTYWNEPAWSISAEWWVYLLIPWLIALLGKACIKRLLIVFPLALVALGLMEWRYGDLGLFYAGWPMLVRCLVEATMGIALYRFYQRGWFGNFPDWAPTAAFVAILLSLALPVPHIISVMLFLLLVPVSAVIRDGDQHWLANKLLVHLGVISYSIYMMHWLVKQAITEPVFWVTGQPVTALLSLPQQGIVVVLALIAVLLISHASYHLVERPWRRRLVTGKFDHSVG